MFGRRKKTIARHIYVAATPDDVAFNVIKQFAKQYGFAYVPLITAGELRQMVANISPSDIFFFSLTQGVTDVPGAFKTTLQKIGNRVGAIFCVVAEKKDVAMVQQSIKPVRVTAYFSKDSFSAGKIVAAFREEGLLTNVGTISKSNVNPQQNPPTTTNTPRRNAFSLFKRAASPTQITTKSKEEPKNEPVQQPEASDFTQPEVNKPEEEEINPVDFVESLFKTTNNEEPEEQKETEEIEQTTETPIESNTENTEVENPPEQVKILQRMPVSGERQMPSVNEQTILFISPYSQSGTTILAENVMLAMALMNADNDIPIAFVDLSFPPKATFHLRLSEMRMPLKTGIQIRPATIDEYFHTGDIKILERGSLAIYDGKVRIFQTFGERQTLTLVQKKPQLISELLNNLKSVYPLIVVSGSNTFSQPFFDAVIKHATSVVEVMKYIPNPLPDDIAEFLMMHNEIAKYEHLEVKIVALNKVSKNLTREERKIMNSFSPYVVVPEVPSVSMRLPVGSSATFNLPLFVTNKDAQYAGFNSAVSELLSKFVGVRG